MNNSDLRVRLKNNQGFFYLKLYAVYLYDVKWLDESCRIDRSTGLKDITGQMIYENDIVENAVPDYFRIQALVEFKEGYIEPFSKNTLKNWRIIGNVYDTPELLKSKR